MHIATASNTQNIFKEDIFRLIFPCTCKNISKMIMVSSPKFLNGKTLFEKYVYRIKYHDFNVRMKYFHFVTILYDI